MNYFNLLVSKLTYKIRMVPCQAASVLAGGRPQVARAGSTALNECHVPGMSEAGKDGGTSTLSSLGAAQGAASLDEKQ